MERQRQMAYFEVILDDDNWCEAKERAEEMLWIMRLCDPDRQAKMPEVPLAPQEEWRNRYLP